MGPAAKQILGLDLTAEQSSALAEMQKRDPLKRRDAVLRQLRVWAQAPAGMTFTTGGHTATKVPLYAVGAGAEAFKDVSDNTQIAQTLDRVMGLKDAKKE